MPLSRSIARWTAVLALTLASALAAAAPDASVTARLHALFERTWDETPQLIPEIGTFRGDHRYGDKLTDMSAEGMAMRDRRARETLAEARAIPRDALSADDRVSLDTFISFYQGLAEEQSFPGWRTMRLGALGGVQSGLAQLLQVSPNRTRAQAEQMLARMAALPRRIDQEIALMQRGLGMGWVPSREVIGRALQQIDRQLAADVTAGPYYQPFVRLPREMPEADRAQLQAAARQAIGEQVVPAMRRLREFVAGPYLAGAPADGALKNYPDGERVYEMLVRHRTTTALSAAEIHRIGLAELARLRKEMEAVMREVRFEGDFAAFAKHLYTDPRFFHRTPEALLAGYREISKRVDAELPKLFAELPRAPYGVVGMPGFMSPDQAEYYQGPAIDGSRAGFFFANLAGYKTRPIWAMETLVAHEAVPGHHLQNARAIEIKALPAFRRAAFGYTAYTEGWALYAETLGFQLGLYTDPYSRFGHLMWQAFRAARLVVDTGMHAFGWPRQRCIDFMIDQTGVEANFVTSEIDRYSSQPGQALGYMIGRMKFEELRDRAKARLGARFDIRRFHNAVLDQGALPLTTLEKLIDEWIEQEAAKKPAA